MSPITSRQPPSQPRLSKATPFLLFTTPLFLRSLPSDSHHCPICTDPYTEYDSNAPDPDLNADTNSAPTAEWAVQIDISATAQRSTRLCGHIFGSRCLQIHLKSKGAWRNKCPLCRCVWFPETAAPPSEITSERVPWLERARMRRSLQIGSRGRGEDDSGGVRVNSEMAERLNGEQDFLRRVLDTFEIGDGRREVRGSVEEVTDVLERLYRDAGVSAARVR